MDDMCFVCSGKGLLKQTKPIPMYLCMNCGSMWQQKSVPKKTDAEIYSEAYYKKIWGYSKETDALVARSKWYVSKKCIKLLHRYKKGGTVLEVGCGLGYLLALLQQDSFCYDVYGIEVSSFAQRVSEERVGKGTIFSSFDFLKKRNILFDSIIFFDSLEHIADQDTLFRDLDALLKDDGIVLVIMPDASSWVAQLFGKNWLEYKEDHVLFYTKKSFAQQLEQKGYHLLLCRSTWKTVTLYYFISYLSVFRIPVVSSFFEFLERLLPEFILNIPLSLPIGQMVAVFERK
ncbi:class I SAM-dependent methyltransferase [Candidatus Woesearchaeota archaeon]|nr:class I SAM-dependent methyltransferase [Candidatus Woesearchaeota archaeon]